MNWYLTVLKKYTTFSGRARRKEYWMFVLFNMIFIFAIMIVGVIPGSVSKNEGYMYFGVALYYLYALAVFIPSLAVSIRRLHDVGESGWFLLLSFIPLIGAIALLVKFCTDGTPGVNQYGANPKETIQ
jgi:uncharacterized membrane protein YhaH (DUF805 family)